MEEDLKKSASPKVTQAINISLLEFYEFLCICLLWKGSYSRQGRFPHSLNTVEAGAERPVGVPSLELQGPPTLPWLIFPPTREDAAATGGGV